MCNSPFMIGHIFIFFNSFDFLESFKLYVLLTVSMSSLFRIFSGYCKRSDVKNLWCSLYSIGVIEGSSCSVMYYLKGSKINNRLSLQGLLQPSNLTKENLCCSRSWIVEYYSIVSDSTKQQWICNQDSHYRRTALRQY
ncbi:hypothetical protein BY458DRAFT_491424 [Sporodiniella umbellata]|nr:hypothetical protein BY458DRAFT_491424 [Sporodiniella umbellata]